MSNFKVTRPMTPPVYHFTETPTTEQLRKTAVQAMMDFLSVPWYLENPITYRKTGAASGKTYIFKADTTYSGLPYTNGDKGLMQFLDYYDADTGKLLFDGTPEEFNKTIGGTCACGVMWSWATVCASLTGLFVNYNMVYKYGCIPVGDYTYDFSIDSFEHDLSTKTICEDNGKQVMFAAYSKMQPADAFTSSKVNHTIMAIETPHLVYGPDGDIDGENSTIIIADQRGGAPGNGNFYEIEKNGEIRRYSGRIAAKYTFEELYRKCYIPVTTAEFAGRKPYEAPQVHFSQDCTCVQELISGELTSNLPMCGLKVKLVEGSGEAKTVVSFQCNKKDVYSGLARKLPMSRFADQLNPDALEAQMEDGKTYTLQVDVTVSSGHTFTPVKVTVTKA